MTSCLLDWCDTNVDTAGYCAKHYKSRRAAGRFGYLDAASTLEHLSKLRALGWSVNGLATATGLSETVFKRLIGGTQKSVRIATARKILAMPLTRGRSKRHTSAVGTSRRIRALNRMGWTTCSLSEMAGLARNTLPKLVLEDAVSADTAARVAEIYDELSGKQGPSNRTRIIAQRRRWEAPIAWEYVDIDDPKAKPFGRFYAKEEVA